MGIGRLSLRIGRLLGIRIDLHVTLLILALWRLIEGARLGGVGWEAAGLGILFASVLLHELGHCLAARALGGSADRVLLWPLGGLALAVTDPSPRNEILVAVAGPAVNLAMLLATGPPLAASGADLGVWLLAVPPGDPRLAVHLLQWVFFVNAAHLLFNLLIPAFPMDGGRVLRGLLWLRLGEARSLLVSSYLAMGIAAALGILGLLGLFGGPLLILIAAFVFASAYAGKRQAEEGLPVGPTPAAPAHTGPVLGGWWERFRLARRRRRERRAARESRALEARVDALLEKVHRVGLEGLSARERRFLRGASRRYRR